VGADEPIAVLGDAQGATLALPIWSALMENAPFLKEALPLQAPDSVQAKIVHPEFGNLSKSGIEMWFMNGDEPDKNGESLEALQADGKSTRGFGVK
jgi:membrane carboxypeptidase/penicillin-binding protein